MQDNVQPNADDKKVVSMSFGTIKGTWPNRAVEARQLHDGLGPDMKPVAGAVKMSWAEIYDQFEAEANAAMAAASKPSKPTVAAQTPPVLDWRTMPIPDDLKAAPEAMAREILRLRLENARLTKAKPAGNITLKVSEKGALSVYGMGRFPITLYREQWERLLAMSEDIKAFIAHFSDKLTKKGEQ